MILSKQHLEYIADNIAPMLSWPTHIAILADDLEKTNPRFKRTKFMDRATRAWESANPPEEINDEIDF